MVTWMVILELFDLDLVALNLRLQTLIQILKGIVHVEGLLVPLKRLLIPRLRPATANQSHGHQHQR